MTAGHSLLILFLVSSNESRLGAISTQDADSDVLEIFSTINLIRRQKFR